MIPQHTPALEPCDGVLDADAALAMTPPSAISNDPPTTKPRNHEMPPAAVTTIGQDAAMVTTERFDL
jgi:hypothetical protein